MNLGMSTYLHLPLTESRRALHHCILTTRGHTSSRAVNNQKQIFPQLHYWWQPDASVENLLYTPLGHWPRWFGLIFFDNNYRRKVSIQGHKLLTRKGGKIKQKQNMSINKQQVNNNSSFQTDPSSGKNEVAGSWRKKIWRLFYLIGNQVFWIF